MSAAATGSGEVILRLEDVHTYYGSIQALKGISIEVREGEIVTLIGANGAGKSTTLRSINGLNTPKQGTITFRGKDITRRAPHDIVEMGISQSPEGRRLFPHMTVLENLEMGAFQRKDRPGIREDLDRVFSLFPRLEERKNQRAGTMSGGEQQMCAIGRALMARPKLLMLDEPSMGLAPIFVEKIFEIIHEINEQGTTILLVEQNALMALDVRPARLRHGDRARSPSPTTRRRCARTSRSRRRTSASSSLRTRRSPRRTDAEREVRGREQIADARRPVGSAVRHGERGADPVRGDEAELPCSGAVPAAGDEHRAQALDGMPAGRPLQERQERMARAARAVGVERAAVRGGLPLDLR